MSMQRYSGLITPTCDICGDELAGEFDFQLAVQSKKDAGWISQKNKDDEWEDICPNCQEGKPCLSI